MADEDMRQTLPGRQDATTRLNRYRSQTKQFGPPPGDYPSGPTGQRLTSAQRRRAVHKSAGSPDRGNLTDPDRFISAGRGRQTYLNPDQFHKMDDIRGYGALDIGAGRTVEDLIPHKLDEVDRGVGDTADYDALSETMRKGGPAGGKVPAILLEPRDSTRGGTSPYQVGNGGHRLALAHELGWKVMPVTSDRSASGYGDDRFPPGRGADSSDSYNDESYHRGSVTRDRYGDTSGTSSSAASESSSYHSEGTGRWAPGARSHVPGAPMGGKMQRGANWHGGRDQFGAPREQGLYTQLHGPAESPAHADPGPGQLTLPGMQSEVVRARWGAKQ